MQTANQELIDRIRANIAFEQMVAAVVYGAFVCSAVRLIVATLAFLTGGDISLMGIFDVVVDTLLYAFMIFLIGFAGAVAIAVPLFLTLEKRRHRKPWPYLVAAIAVELVFFLVARSAGAMPVEPPFLHLIAWFAPAPIIAVLFGRLMKPLWLEIERNVPSVEEGGFPRLN